MFCEAGEVEDLAMIDIQAELPQFALGCVGGAISEVLHWHRIARRGRWPQYAHSFGYWIITVVFLAAGGVVAAAVSPPNSSPLQLLLLGIVGPQLLQSAARAQNFKRQGGDVHLGASHGQFREFLSF